MTAINVRPLPADLQKVAIEELNEVPERVATDIEALKVWIQQQPHLKARTSDQFLLAFLRGSKFSLEKAKSKIDQFYTLRSKYPEYLGGALHITIERAIEILKLGPMLYLPTPLNDNGLRIAIFRMGSFPAEIMPELFCFGQLLQEITMLEDDYAIVNGLAGIIDMTNVGAAHMLNMTPSFMKKMTVWTEEAIPLRPKANHFVHTPAGFEPIFNMFKSMLSQKLQDRLYVHGSKMELLHEQIPKKYLPREYGGENGCVQDIIDYWEKLLLKYSDYFKEEINYGTDEKLRPGKPIDFESLFGLDGSFRKLNVD